MRGMSWRGYLLAALLTGAALAGWVWADEKIEMSTYVPAPSNTWDRVHANRATVGSPYSIINPAEPAPADGTLLVAQRLGVGIGNNAPTGRLQIVGAEGTVNFIAQAGAGQTTTSLAEFRDPAGTTLVKINPAGGTFIQPNDPSVVPLELRGVTGQTADLFRVRNVSANPYLVVKAGGNVGIGTAAPEQALHVKGAVLFDRHSFFIRNSGSPPGARTWGIVINTNNGQFNLGQAIDTPGFGGGGLAHSSFVISPGAPDSSFWIQSNGNIAGIYGTYHSSDLRMKKDVAPIPDALDRLLLLRGITFRWKDPALDQRPQIGLIGQEVEKIFPEVVRTDPEGRKGVAYERMTAVLVEAVKELKANTERLEAENQLLRQRIEKLEER